MKKTVAVVLSIVLLVATLAGCTTKVTDGVVSQTSAMKSEVKNVELEFIHWGPFDDKLLAEFTKANPNIKINFQMLTADQFNTTQRTRIAGGGQLDISGVRPENYAEFTSAGYLVDLTKEAFLSNYFDASLAQGRAKDGKIYAITLGSFVEGVWYNKDVFEKLKLKEPKTYAEYLEVCRVIKESGMTPVIIGGKAPWTNYFLTMPSIHKMWVSNPELVNQLYNGTVKFTDAGFVDAYTKARDFIKKEYVDKNSLTYMPVDAVQNFVQAKAAMFISGSWNVSSFNGITVPFKMGAFSVPNIDGNESSFSSGLYVSIMKQSTHQAEAMKFLEFISNKDTGGKMYYDIKGDLPSIKGVDAINPLLEIWNPLNSTPGGKMSYRMFLTQTTNDAMFKGIQELWGDKSITQILKDTQDAHEKGIKTAEAAAAASASKK